MHTIYIPALTQFPQVGDVLSLPQQTWCHIFQVVNWVTACAVRLQPTWAKFKDNLVYKVCRFTLCRPAQWWRARGASLTFVLYSKDHTKKTLFLVWRSLTEENICTHSLTCLHKRTHTHTHIYRSRRPCLYLQSSWKEEGSSSWQAFCTRSIQVCFYLSLCTPLLLCYFILRWALFICCSFALLCWFNISYIIPVSPTFLPSTTSITNFLCSVLLSLLSSAGIVVQRDASGSSASRKRRLGERLCSAEVLACSVRAASKWCAGARKYKDTETHPDLFFSHQPAQPLTSRIQVVFLSQVVDRDWPWRWLARNAVYVRLESK